MPTNYAFTANIPQSSQKKSATQAPIQSNFQAINELINANHVGFTDQVNFGKHNFTTFPAQMSDPTTLSNEMALYSKSVSGDANGQELFMRYPNSGTVVQLTASNTSPSGGTGGTTFLAASPGYSYLAGNILIKWGTSSITNGVVTYPTAGGIPAFTTSVYNVTCLIQVPSPNPNASKIFFTNFGLTSFTANYTAESTSATYNWIAIGI